MLSAIQELQLLELLCSCFKAAPEKHKYRIFQLMFGNRGDEVANTLLTKMVSMALSVSCTSVLDCAAIWMQVCMGNCQVEKKRGIKEVQGEIRRESQTEKETCRGVKYAVKEFVWGIGILLISYDHL